MDNHSYTEEQPELVKEDISAIRKVFKELNKKQQEYEKSENTY